MSPNRAWNNRQVPLSVGLRTAARLRPQAKALVSVDAGGDTCHDYAELDRRATRIACQLANMGGAGERALLLMDSGIDYVSAFYGCLYAGVIAVPVFPPESSRAQHIARLAKIAEDARVRFVLTTAALDARFGPQYRQLAPRAAIVSVDTLSVSDAAPDDFAPCDAGPDDVAFLQYTSGSTGQPKGVMVSHGNLVANQQALAAAWGASSADVYVSWLPLYHDMGLIGAMMQAFFSGMTLVLMSPQYFLAHPLRWLQAIDRHGGTLTGAPDFAYRLCADHIRPDTAASLDLSHLRIAYSGSEPVRKSTLEAFAARFAPAGFDPKALFPCYGLAEATLFVSGGLPGHGFTATVFGAAPLAAGQARAASPGEPGVPLVACGTAQAPHAIRIVDPRNGASMPAGSVGEIEVRGPSVTLGYWQRPDASADVFRDSRDGSAGQAVRWLRTGDLGFMHEGMLYVAARRKDLIIVRGRNLYPQDIEQTVEDTCDIVRKGRVAAFDAEVDGREGPGLAVEIPPLLRKRLSAAHIVEQLSRCVFDACGEAPSAIVLLNGGGLPKTSSGKVQRAAVRQGWRDRTLDAWAIWERGIFVHGGDGVRDVSHDRAAAAFNSEIEQTLAQLWREVLGTEPASRDTHFFAAGGSSLGAARLASLIGKRWARPADMGLVFEFPVFSAMALAVARLSQAVASPVEDDAVLADIPRANTGVTSHAQQRQLFAARLDPRGTAYHIAVALRLRGHLDTSALRQSLDHLVARHAALRMVFVEQRDTHVPEVRAASPHGWTCLALPDGVAATDADALDNAIAAASQRFAAAPFDLANGPLIRFGLLALDDDDHVLLIALHHIAADGWSMRLLIDDWAAHYRALATGEMLPPPAPDRPAYGDYAAWQRHWLRGAQAARQRAYWSAELAGMPPPAPLPYERTGTVPGGGAEAARIDFAVPAETFERLRTAATRAGTTPFVLALAAWHLWLHRMSGQADICTGVPVANRRNDAVRHIVGFFVNTLAIRSRCTSATCVASLVAELRRAVLDGLSHQELPFDVLVEHLNPERGTESIPLCQTLFNYLQDDYPSLRALPGLTASCREIAPGHAKTRLAMDLRESGGDTLRGFLTYVPAAFAAADAQRIVAQYRRALDGVVEALLGDMRGHDRPLADLDLLGRAETARIRHASQGEVIADVFEPVHRRFARHARMSPQAIAIVDGDVRLTYRQLDQRAEHIARWLAERGLAAEQRVAVIAERSWAFVAAMLGVLKAGGTYVPIDAATPPTRIAQLLRDCGAAGVLAERADSVGSVDGTDGEAGSCGIIAAIAGDGPSLSDGSCAEPDVDPRQAAYVIYTSGSTGTPKGVVVPHASLSNYAASLLSVLQPPAGAAFAMVSTVAADLGHTALFGALCCGGILHLIDRRTTLDADRFAAYMHAHRIDVLKIVPSHLAALLHAARPADVLPRAALVLGGEASPWALVDRIRALAPACRVFNHYGPTETTVGVTMQPAAQACRDAATLPVGRPLGNQRAWVLDARMQPVGIGLAGELYLGGAGVSRGYLNRPAQTAECFVPSPFEPGERLYRSGDRARRLADGAIEYLGRLDDQLKIRGYRIEPAEVAARLRALAGVHETHVLATPEGRLVAFVTAHAGQALDTAMLRRQLASVVPDYMLPSALLQLDALPLNRNGKIDRQALLSRAREARQRQPAGRAAPCTDTEQALARIWAAVLGTTQAGEADNTHNDKRNDRESDISRDDNFFSIGGHSLAAMRMLSRIRAAWSIDLPLRDVLGAPDLRVLAEVIDRHASRAQPVAHAPVGGGESIRHADRHAALPLSPLQQRLWIVDRLAGGRLAAYNMVAGLSFEGELDADLLEASLNHLVARHEVLRASFPEEDGMPAARFADALRVAMPVHDVDPPTAGAWRQTVDAGLAEAAGRPFDLTVPPLLRATLLRFGARHHVLVLSLHHIVADGASIHILVRELMAAYRALHEGQAPALAPLPVQYADYAMARRAAMSPAMVHAEQAFWRGYLAGAPHGLRLPVAASDGTHAGAAGEAVRCRLNARIGTRVRSMAVRERTTPFAVLLASFQWFLHGLSGQRDLIIGTDVADREQPELEGLIGFFINVLPIRSTLPDPAQPCPDFPAWLAASRRSAWQAIEHRALPFDRIVEALKVVRKRDANPLVQVLFVQRDLPHRDTSAPGLAVELVRPPTVQSKFDMALFVEPRDGGYDVEWVFASRRLDRATVTAWFAQWSSMLADMLDTDGALPWPHARQRSSADTHTGGMLAVAQTAEE